MGLEVNDEKTKYMICNENKKKIQSRTDQQLKIGENRFEKGTELHIPLITDECS